MISGLCPKCNGAKNPNDLISSEKPSIQESKPPANQKPTNLKSGRPDSKDQKGPHPDIEPYLVFDFGPPGTDPSTIYCALPIKEPGSPSDVDRLPYYPSYFSMTPYQRWTYLSFLSNPYDSSYDIGYVFVLYYGLEGWLSTAFFPDVVNIILKLREAHPHPSLLFYSAHALVNACMKRNDPITLRHVITSNGLAGLSDVMQLYLLCLFGLPLTAQFIIDSASSWGFTNKRYIKMYPERFLATLKDEIEQQFNRDYISTLDFAEITARTAKIVPGSANSSLSEHIVTVPNYFESPQLKPLVSSLLTKTHERIKKKLAKERKKSS